MIKDAKYIISSPDVKDCPQSGLPEYAFIGRSNVGKSSLINMLCHNPKLAKTSQKPGKTLLINHFLVESGELRVERSSKAESSKWHLVDLPGYGYAQAGQKQRDALKRMIERYCLLREQLVCLFVLIDCRHEAQKIDIEFISDCFHQGRQAGQNAAQRERKKKKKTAVGRMGRTAAGICDFFRNRAWRRRTDGLY